MQQHQDPFEENFQVDNTHPRNEGAPLRNSSDEDDETLKLRTTSNAYTTLHSHLNPTQENRIQKVVAQHHHNHHPLNHPSHLHHSTLKGTTSSTSTTWSSLIGTPKKLERSFATTTTVCLNYSDNFILNDLCSEQTNNNNNQQQQQLSTNKALPPHTREAFDDEEKKEHKEVLPIPLTTKVRPPTIRPPKTGFARVQQQTEPELQHQPPNFLNDYAQQRKKFLLARNEVSTENLELLSSSPPETPLGAFTSSDSSLSLNSPNSPLHHHNDRKYTLLDRTTAMYLRKRDLVMIVVDDEELGITGSAFVDPYLHGKIGNVLTINEDEAKNSASIASMQSVDMNVPLVKFKHRKKVWVPKFCLCLQTEVLRKRMQKEPSHIPDLFNSKYDSGDEDDANSSSGYDDDNGYVFLQTTSNKSQEQSTGIKTTQTNPCGQQLESSPFMKVG
ncbi:hypothetical protein C9374_010960 [Naegleria lovaniensis]|uniref:Uncharacterized protein n=1 Tax=Naegleria lovaniensis TaxID=51637 RepID=A0AA88KD36_NAELO|nr:uncharacterized protein C9374_010960 [Naegleria lovaniensis]KAG2374390.1 hypothetical protein C9374_010960 [Naegleria lovaniensis]